LSAGEKNRKRQTFICRRAKDKKKTPTTASKGNKKSNRDEEVLEHDARWGQCVKERKKNRHLTYTSSTDVLAKGHQKGKWLLVSEGKKPRTIEVHQKKQPDLTLWGVGGFLPRGNFKTNGLGVPQQITETKSLG